MKIPYIVSLVFLISVIAIFFFTTSPSPALREVVNWNLLLIGGISSTVLFFALKQKSETYFAVNNSKEFFLEVSAGVIWGLITVLIINALLSGIQFLPALFGSINLSQVSFTFSDYLMLLLFQPLTETLMLVAMILVLSHYFKSKKLPILLAVIVVALLFASLHFVSVGKANYEYSMQGFTNFLFDTQNIGTPNYTGALPQLLMGLVWGIIAVAYRSYLVPTFAHITLNLTGVMILGQPALIVSVLGLILLLAVAYTSYKFGLNLLFTPKLRELVGR